MKWKTGDNSEQNLTIRSNAFNTLAAMKKILVIGAGRSCTSLIKYFLDNSDTEDWKITVADISMELCEHKINGHPNGLAMLFDVNNDELREKAISDHDHVVSMLPAHMHVSVAKDCIKFGKNMSTASYISPEMRALDSDAKAAGITIINEIGVDPGVDHISAMRILDKIRDEGGHVHQFESFTGGLLAPESEDNPWKYKFTWNPRNVVVAGQGGAVKFLHNGKYKYIPYQRVFRRTEFIDIDGLGRFEGYANRDSLSYREVYGLDDVETIYRGTLRRPGYCRAWNVFVMIGATDDSYILEGSKDMTHREFMNTFLPYHATDSVELKLAHYLNIPQDTDVMEKLESAGVFSTEQIGLTEDATPAQILEIILKKVWTLNEDDKDMIVMWHRFGYELNGQKHTLDSSMVCIGDDREHTAMSKTVGFPLAIATKMLINGQISEKGVIMPLSKEVYNPILDELEQFGISFTEKEA